MKSTNLVSMSDFSIANFYTYVGLKKVMARNIYEKQCFRTFSVFLASAAVSRT